MHFRLLKLAVLYSLVLISAPSLFSQVNDILGTAFEPSSDGIGIEITFQGGKNPAGQLQLVFQRFNEYDDRVGDPISKSITVEPGKVGRTKLTSDDLKGAAAIRYWLTTAATVPGQSTMPVKVDLVALRKPDALKKECDDFRQQAERNSQQAKSDYAAALAAKDKDISTLKDRLASLGKAVVAKFLPNNISLDRDPEVFPAKVGFYIRTNKAGPIMVSAFKDSENRTLIETVQSTNLLTLHKVSFDKGLAPGTTYRFEVSVLNFDGTPYPDGTVFTFKNDDRLRITMPGQVPVPVFTIERPELTEGKLKAKVTPSSKVLLSAELLEERGAKYEVFKRDGITLETTSFGRPTNQDADYTPASHAREFEFDGVKPETRYQVVITAIDGLGQITKQTYPDTISTPKRAPDFDFSGSVELNISPTGFTATWQATTKPDSGSFSVVFKDGGPITSQPANIEGNRLTATLGADALKRFYAKAKENSQPKDEDKPTLKFTMTKGSLPPKEATIKIAYTIPTAAQLDEAVKKGILTDEDKKKIQDVVKNSATNGKVKWQDLLATGVGIVLKFL